MYQQEITIDVEEDLLCWWKANLGRLRQYLCNCATSAPPERMFCTAGSVVTPLCSLLKPER